MHKYLIEGRLTCVPKMHPFLPSKVQEPWLTISHVNTYVVSLILGYINSTQNNIHLRKQKAKQSNKHLSRAS